MPTLVSYVYWLRKEAFLLDADSYADWVMFVVEDGLFQYEIGEAAAGSAGPGDIVVCPPQQIFARKAILPVSFHFISFTSPIELPAGKIRLANPSRYADNCARLRAHRQDRSELSERVRTHMMRDLWLLILEASGIGMYAQQGYESTPSCTDPIMLAVKTALEASAYEPLQLKEIAARHRLTPVQLSRRFRACFGMNPNAFVTELRLRRAGELLTETSRTIEDIASACGYESGFYLSRIFAKHIGLSPGRYRERYRV